MRLFTNALLQNKCKTEYHIYKSLIRVECSNIWSDPLFLMYIVYVIVVVRDVICVFSYRDLFMNTLHKYVIYYATINE